MKNLTAIIAARKGSIRLPNKHILEFGDSNILIRKIRQLKEVPSIDSIIVSTDCDIMLEMARSEGVETHVRPPEYCDEKTKNYAELVAYLASSFETENILWAPCVCPLVDAPFYVDAIRKYKELVLETHQYDGVISAYSFKEFLWDGKKPLNFGLGRTGHRRSQDLPEWSVIINAFFIAPREKMIEWEFHFGLNSYLYIVPKEKSIDIDTSLDFKIAKALLEQ
ncbi:MAG: hypothetical protein LBJ14_10630 [Desulfarculales bacterium]|jgi:N-acylneuraminate cytidylyltransferase|nr:hypothetical protein [Desulfarculales bacterium]